MRRNLNQSFTGSRILGTPQVGVLASAIPSSGDQGASLLYNKISAGDPAGCLYRVWMTSQPASGTLSVDETGAFTFSGAPDGTYTAGERVDKYDPAVGLSSTDTGTAKFYVNVPGAALAGAAVAQVSVSGSLVPVGAALSGSAAAAAALAGSLVGTSAALSGSIAAQAGASATLTTAIALSGSAVAQASVSALFTLSSAALSGSAVASATIGATLTTAIRLAGAVMAESIVTAKLTDVYANIVIDPERILVIPNPNQPPALASAVITDYVLRSGQWTIDKDPRAELFYGVDARTDLALAETTVERVIAIPTGVTLSLPGFVHDPAGIVGAKISGMDASSDDAINCVTFLFMCANTEVVPHTIYFRNKAQ